MQLRGRIEVNTTAAEVAARGDVFANVLAQIMARDALQLARENVAPGKGPGPHPHKPESHHTDTGNLMRSLDVEPEERGFLKTCSVGTDVDYGVYLELGWTNPNTGNFWRYPWLWPAVQQVQADAEETARTTAREFFGGDVVTVARSGGRGYRG